MKTATKLIVAISAMISLIACSVQPGADVVEENNLINRPQTVFEGKWTWLKTEGEGIAGTYKSDSVSVGYSLLYDFSFSELQTFKNSEKLDHYTYTYSVSETEKPEGQRLMLRDSFGKETAFLWELKNIEGKNYLILRNTEPCCDNTFDQHFRMIAGPDLHGSK